MCLKNYTYLPPNTKGARCNHNSQFVKLDCLICMFMSEMAMGFLISQELLLVLLRGDGTNGVLLGQRGGLFELKGYFARYV